MVMVFLVPSTSTTKLLPRCRDIKTPTGYGTFPSGSTSASTKSWRSKSRCTNCSGAPTMVCNRLFIAAARCAGEMHIFTKAHRVMRFMCIDIMSQVIVDDADASFIPLYQPQVPSTTRRGPAQLETCSIPKAELPRGSNPHQFNRPLHFPC